MNIPRWSTDAALLVLRLVTGFIMIAHGAQKVFEFTPSGTGASFEQMGVPLGGLVGPVVAFVELVGGIALILGLATRIVGALFVLDMIGALVIVHVSNGLFAADGGYELVAILGAASLALALAGPGRWAADAAIARALPRSHRSPASA